jgi:hypothetical protein
MNSDPFDPAALRIDPRDADVFGKRKRRRNRAVEAGIALPRPRGKEPYLGPIPMGWIERAAVLPGRAWHLATALWFEAITSPRKSRTVKLSSKTMRRFGVTRRTYYRALVALQAASLISVDVRPGQAALVTILDTPKEE